MKATKTTNNQNRNYHNNNLYKDQNKTKQLQSKILNQTNISIQSKINYL